jgi:hypothetical protein
LVQKFWRSRLYNALTVSILLYGIEIWTLTKVKGGRGRRRGTMTTTDINGSKKISGKYLPGKTPFGQKKE